MATDADTPNYADIPGDGAEAPGNIIIRQMYGLDEEDQTAAYLLFLETTGQAMTAEEKQSLRAWRQAFDIPQPVDPETIRRMQRYALFRQFMFNDLAITRDEIMAWTKQAVAETIDKRMTEISTTALDQRIDRHIRNYYSGEVIRTAAREVGEELAKRVTITVTN